jgi:hypothetical protein
MRKAFNVLLSVKKVCLVLIAAAICFGCNKNNDGSPNVVVEDDSTVSTPELLPAAESFPMAVIEVDASSYYFENQEYYFRAYYDDLRSPPFRFSFYDGLFYMDIPELDDGTIDLTGQRIKGNIQGRYTIIEENGLVYILAAEKKYLVLYNESVVCVLLDCQNNDAFFGFNKNSIYVTIREGRYPFIGFAGQWSFDTRVSSFLTETVSGSVKNYDGFPEKYQFELRKPWVEGVDGHGIGEWLETRPIGSPSNLSGILFFNGYIDPNRPDLFYANSRIKEVLVTSTQYSWTYQIQDTPNPQIMPLPENFDDILRFTIMDVYEGSRYSDTCLAGIYFLLVY